MMLLLADGMSLIHIATTVGMSRRFVYKWVQRFQQEGVAGLTDKPGRGRRSGLRLQDRWEEQDAGRA